MAYLRTIPGSEIIGDDGTVQSFGLHDPTTGETIHVPNMRGEYDMFMEQERQMNAKPVATAGNMLNAPADMPEDPPMPDAPQPVASMDDAFDTATRSETPNMLPEDGTPDIPANISGPNANKPVALPESMPQPSGTPIPEVSTTPAPVENTAVAPTIPDKVELNSAKKTTVGEGSKSDLTPEAKALRLKAEKEGSEAIIAQATAAKAQAQLDNAKAMVTQQVLQDQAEAELKRKEAENADRMKREAEISADIDAFSAMKIDNDRRWANASTGDRVATGIALLLGSVGSAFTGKENPVIKMMDDDIRRDIEAQKAEMNNKGDAITAKRGMLNELVKRYGDLDKAAEVARASAWKTVSAQFDAMATNPANITPQLEAAMAASKAKLADSTADAFGKAEVRSGGRTTSEMSSEEQVPKGAPPLHLTEGADKEIRDAAITRNTIDALIPDLADPKVRGTFGQAGSRRAYIERFFNATTPEADQFRARLEAVKGKIRSKMFGASLTESELAAFEKFVPGDTASADRIMNALISIRNDAELSENVVREQNKNRAGVPSKVGKYESDKKRDRDNGFVPAK